MFDGLRIAFSRLRGLARRNREDREFEQELETHLALLTEENIRRGMAPEEARRAARLRLGATEQLREANHELRGLASVEGFFRDVGHAWRMLRKTPGFTWAAILTLALGIGANVAIFSIVNVVLLRPLPARDPGQLVVLAYEQRGGKLESYFSYPNMRDIRGQTKAVFSGVATYRTSFDGLGSGGHAQRVLSAYVSSNFFSLLGLRPPLGRLIEPSEGGVYSAHPEIVLSYAFWKSQFGGDRGIVGRGVSLNGHPVTVIGVGPKGFHGVYPFIETQVYLPMSMMMVENWMSRSLLQNRNGGPFQIWARLRPGVSVKQAQSALNVVAARLASEHPKSDAKFSLAAIPETLARPFPMRPNPVPEVAALFLALAAMVLVLACVNVANLLLVRAVSRGRELAIRAALGSTRGRLVRQLLTESLLLGLMGGAGGLLLGMWICGAIGSVSFSPGLPLLLDFPFDWRVFLFSFGAALLTGVLVGILPALRASRVAPGAILHQGGRSVAGGRQRLRSALVVAQVAGSLMLLVVAALFARSLQRVQQVHLGFDPAHVLNLSMDPSEIGYSDAQARVFYKEMIERARTLLGVGSAALAFTIPMRTYTPQMDFIGVEGYTAPPGQPKPLVNFNSVSPGYFRTMRISLVRGRTFTDADNRKAQYVAVVNEAMAKRFWPNQDPIGRKFRMTHYSAGHWLDVVGVVANGRMLAPFGKVAPFFFVPFAQNFGSYATLQLRTLGPAASVIPEVRSLVRSLAPGLPVFDVGTMREEISGSGFLLFRFGAVLAAALGLLGLVLALVGVYGVTSYAASQRMQEIGIRMALGARPAQILKSTFAQGAVLVGAGLVIGLAGALGAARLAASFLIVSPTDPLTFIAVPLGLAVVAFVACYLPARRAMHIEPTQALRFE